MTQHEEMCWYTKVQIKGNTSHITVLIIQMAQGSGTSIGQSVGRYGFYPGYRVTNHPVSLRTKKLPQDMRLSVLKLGQSQVNWDGWSTYLALLHSTYDPG